MSDSRQPVENADYSQAESGTQSLRSSVDEMVQVLFGFRLAVETLKRAMVENPETLPQLFDSLQQQTDEVIEKIRRVSTHLIVDNASTLVRGSADKENRVSAVIPVADEVIITDDEIDAASATWDAVMPEHKGC